LCLVVAGMPVDHVLTLRKAEISVRVRDLAQRTLNRLGVGVQLLSTTVERAAPPEAVADAFRDVTSARADRGRRIAEAEGYRDDLLPKARGEARKIGADAEASAFATVELARARAMRFERTLNQAALSPELTRRRLYAEAMEEILGRTRKVVVSPRAAPEVRLVEEGP
jgi:membrane protease subunit HflK